jgi:hypothetical protein
MIVRVNLNSQLLRFLLLALNLTRKLLYEMTGGLLIELLKHSFFFGLPIATLANCFGGHIPISNDRTINL